MKILLQILQRILLTLLLAGLLFALRWQVLPVWDFLYGADGWFISTLIENDPFPLYYRSLLTVLIHKLFYVIGNPLGLSGWYAIAISSSLAGAIALQGLWAICPHPLFMAINIFSGSFLVFVGHVENYAWVNTFLILMFWWVKRWLHEDIPLWPAILFYVLACLSHMLALFYAPALFYLLWRERRYHPYEVLLPVLLFLSIIVICNLFFQLLGTDNGLERIVPLFTKWAPNHHFTLFSAAHLEMLLFFHICAAFLGLPLEIPLLIFFCKRVDTLYLKFLLFNVLCGLIWTTLWHPDWGRRDWDLFSQFGIPMHILLGRLVVDYVQTYRKENTDIAQCRGSGRDRGDLT